MKLKQNKIIMKYKLLNADKQKNHAIILDSGDEVMESVHHSQKKKN